MPYHPFDLKQMSLKNVIVSIIRLLKEFLSDIFVICLQILYHSNDM